MATPIRCDMFVQGEGGAEVLCPNGAGILVSNLDNGDTLGLCGVHLPLWCAGILAAAETPAPAGDDDGGAAARRPRRRPRIPVALDSQGSGAAVAPETTAETAPV